MKVDKQKSISQFLSKVEPKYGFTLSNAIKTYFSQVPQLTAEQFAVMVLADENMDIVMNLTLKNEIEQGFIDFFGTNLIANA